MQGGQGLSGKKRGRGKKVLRGKRKICLSMVDNFLEMLYNLICIYACLCPEGSSGLGQGRANRGDSGALYLQSAKAGANPGPRKRAVSSDPGKQ